MGKGIELEHIGKTFEDGTVAVHDLSLTIADGEFFILLGPSGCGKSTILNMIVGLESVSTGAIRVDGEMVNDRDPKDRNMAMVFQSYALYPHMTVRQNMEFPLKLAGMEKDKVAQKVTRTAAILELEELLDRKPGALSGGQRQRVAMGRAIVREPKAFLLDEPLSNLDAKLRVQMRTEIRKLHRRLGVTMIYVTHDQTEAMTLGDRLALLQKGKLQQLGTPRDLYSAPRNLFTAGFIGSPAMNFLPAAVREGYLLLPMLQLPLREIAFTGDLPANCIVGLRPEHIFVVDSGRETARLLFQAEAGMIEWLGADAYVHFEIESAIWPNLPAMAAGQQSGMTSKGRLAMTVRLNPSRTIHPGDHLELAIDPEKLHLFDPGSGARLN
ncbi:MAG: sn-glycerol-3-phosphate ABC transporter ATP-binding protein UgpC [Deltaproteobacteria bacterium]